MMTEAMKPMGFSIFLTFAHFVKGYFKMQNHVIVESGSRIYFDLMQIIKFKIFQKNLPEVLVNIDETASKILTEFMNLDEFKKIKTERISFKRAWILIKFVLLEIRLFFFGNHDNIFDPLNKAISEEIIGFRNIMEQTTSIEKIQKIKIFITSLPVKITNTKILNYMPLAIGSYKLLGIFSKKRLGDMDEVDAI
jgi:pyruvate,water dikinase